MRRLLGTMLLAACVACPALAAPVISVVPSVAKAHVGVPFSVDIVISGLDRSTPAGLLGGFQLALDFDPARVDLDFFAIRLGSGLGVIGDELQTVSGSSYLVGGPTVRIEEVSLLEASAATCLFCTGPYLEDLQGDSFTLASLDFTPRNTGTPDWFTDFFLRPRELVLSDANGDGITGVALQAGTVRLVDEPASVLMSLTALALMAGFGRRRRIARP